jgi:hypothetical protein
MPGLLLLRTSTPHPTAQPTPNGGTLSGMLGTWDFTFSILSSPFTDTYRMRQLVTANGLTAIATLNQFGEPQLVFRLHDVSPDSPLPYEFEMLDNQGSFLCDFHLWNRTANTVSGLTFVVLTSGGQCDPSTLHGSGYSMVGFRTSTSAAAPGIEQLQVPVEDVVSARARSVILEDGLTSEAEIATDGVDSIRRALEDIVAH